MNIADQIQELLIQFSAIMLIFLPVLFGAVEFIKEKMSLTGRTVEMTAIGLFTLFGGIEVLSFYFPETGAQVGAVIIFLLMCALAPSGYYKFISARIPKKIIV